MMPGSHPDLTAYVNEPLRISKPEQHSSTIWFLNSKNPNGTDDQTPIQTGIPCQLNETKAKEKLNPLRNNESKRKMVDRFDWTDRFLGESEKQAVKNSLVEYHDSFARHKNDIGMKRV